MLAKANLAAHGVNRPCGQRFQRRGHSSRRTPLHSDLPPQIVEILRDFRPLFSRAQRDAIARRHGGPAAQIQRVDGSAQLRR